MVDERYSHVFRQDCPLPPGSPVVGYCRDSGGEEQERSVKQQSQAIQEYCEKHGLILEQIYTDEAKLSSNSEHRDALNEMIAGLQSRFKQIRNLEKRTKYRDEHHFGVVFWKANRIGRDMLDATYIKSDLGLRGITIISLVAAATTGDPTIDAIIESVQQHHDQNLLKELSDNSKRGLSGNSSLRDNDPTFRSYNPDWPTNDGRYLGIKCGQLPTGFKGEKILVGVRDRKERKQGGEKHYIQRMVPNHDDNIWERCRLAWQMRHDGAPIKKIMEATNLFRTVSGFDHFFENRIYAGDLVYGGKTYENFVPALIPRDWWEEEQKHRQERVAKQKKLQMDPMHEPRRIASRHLLTGLVYCSAVEGEEHPMNADTVPAREGKRTRWDFYICAHKKNSRERSCRAGRVGAAALDQAVIERLREDVLTKENLQPIADALANALMERNHDVKESMVALEGQLEEVQRIINRLVDEVERGHASPNLRVRLQEREAEERKLIAQLGNLENQIVKPRDVPTITGKQLNEWIESIHRALTGDNLDLARRAIRQFVAKVVVNGKAGTIFYTFPLSNLSRLHEVAPTGLQPTRRTWSLAA